MTRSNPLKSVARLVLIAMLVTQPLQALASDPPSTIAYGEATTLPLHGALDYQPATDRFPMGESAVPRSDAAGGGGAADAGTSTGTVIVIIVVVVLIAVAVGGGGGGGY